ncbi:MAG: FkbM family methyltransferase [Candidatus Staskawiczbacteria bacterium]|nr:FkbM family methyltransferase [Candidatus Staskawiczbacteria bacterium]
MFKNYYSIAKELFHLLAVNPRFCLKRVSLQLRSFFLSVPNSKVLGDVNGIPFEFDFDFSSRFKDMYVSTYQPIIKELVEKNLREGDTFIDIGANVGYFSAVALGRVGKTGQVHSFEPVPEYFEKLKRVADLNSRYNITINQVALGDEEKKENIYIAGRSAIGNNTFFKGLLDEPERAIIREIVVRRLDDYILEKNIKNIKLVKIDVEGFEFPVLKGLGGYFSGRERNSYRPLIICEIVPLIYPEMGYKLNDLFDYMAGFSYFPFEVANTKKRVNINKIARKRVTDVVFKFCGN